MANRYELTAELVSRFDPKGFDDLERRIDAYENRLARLERDIEFEATLSTDRLDAGLRDLDARLSAKERSLEYEARLSTDRMDAEVRAFETRIASQDRRLEYQARLDTRDAETRLGAFEGFMRGVADRISALRPNLVARADTREAEARIGNFERFVGGTASRISALRPTLTARGDTQDAQNRFAGLEGFVRGMAGRISSLRPTLVARGDTRDAETRVGALEGFMRGVAARIASLRPTLNVDADTGAATAKVGAFAAFVRGITTSIGSLRSVIDVRVNDNDSPEVLSTIGKAFEFLKAQVASAQGGVASFAQSIRDAGAIVGGAVAAMRLPAMLTALGVLPTVVTAAGAGLVALANGAVVAGAGLAGFGANVLAGIGGLKAYAAIVGTVAKASQEGEFAFTRHARASETFNATLTRLKEGFRGLVLDIGGRGLPVMTRFLEAGIQQLPLVGRVMDRLVTSVNDAALGFLRAATQSRQLRNIEVALNAAALSAGRLLTIGGNLALTLVNLFAGANFDGNRFVKVLVDLSEHMRRVSASAGFLGRVEDFMQRASDAALRLVRGTANLVVGLFQVGAAIDRSGLTTVLTTGLLRATESFRQLTREGGRGAAQIVQMGRLVGPVLRDIGGLVLAAGKEFLLLARNVAQAGRDASGMTTLRRLLAGVREALPPLRRAFESTFRVLGPSIARAVPEFARLLQSLSAAAPVMARVVDAVTRAVRAFNNLPAPLRNAVVVIGAVTSAVTGIGIALRITGALFAPFIRVIGRVGAALGGAVARFAAARLGVFALAALLGPGAALLTGLTALAAALVAAYRRSETFRSLVNGAASAVRNFASRALQFVVDKARAFGSGMVSAANSVRDFAGRAVGFVRDLPGRIGSFLSRIPGIVRDNFARARDWAAETASSLVSRVVQFFKDLPHNALFLLGQMARHVYDGFLKAKDWAISTAKALYHGTIEFFQQLPGRVASFVTNLATSVRDGFVRAKDWAVSTATALYHGTVEWFSQLPGRVASFVTSTASAVRDGFVAAKDSAVSTASSLVTSAVDLFASLPAKALAALKGLATSVRDAFVAAKDAAISAVQNLISDAIGLLSSLPGKITGALSGVKDAIVKPFMDGWNSVSKNTITRNLVRDVGVNLSRAPRVIDAALRTVPSRISNPFRAAVGESKKHLDELRRAAASPVTANLRAAGGGLPQTAALRPTPATQAPRPHLSGREGPGEAEALVRGAGRASRRLADDANRNGADLRKNLVGHLKVTREEGLREFEGLGKGGTLAAEALRNRTVALVGEMGKQNLAAFRALQVGGVGESEELRAKSVAAVETMRRGSRAATVGMEKDNLAAFGRLRAGGTRESELLNANASRQSLDMQRNVVSRTTEMQRRGTAQARLLQENGTREQTLLQANATRQSSLARTNVVRSLTDAQTQGSGQLRTLNANGTREATVLQENATRQTDAMRRNVVRLVTETQVEGVRQLVAFKDGGNRAMTAAGEEWPRPVDSAKRTTIKYLNDMLVGMNRFIDETKVDVKKANPIPIPGGAAGAPVRMAEGGVLERDPVRYMAEGGVLERDIADIVRRATRQGSTGGVADGTTPRAVYGEVGRREYYIVPEREDNIPLLHAAASDMGMEVVGRCTGDGHSRQAPRRMAAGGVLEDGVELFAVGGIASAEKMASEVQRRFGPVTLVNEHYRYLDPDAARRSVDFFVAPAGTVAQGADKAKGDRIAAFVSPPSTEYAIWFNDANFGAGWGAPFTPLGIGNQNTLLHYDHVHATAHEGNFVGGKGGAPGPDFNALLEKHLPKVPAYPEHLVGGAAKSMAEGLRAALVRKLEKEVGVSGWDGTGNLIDWIKKGFVLSGVAGPTAENVAKFQRLAMKESGGDPKVTQQIVDINSTLEGAGGFPDNLARGLMQNTPQTWEGQRANPAPDVGRANPNIFDPIKSVAVRARNQMSALGYINDQPGYTSGGIALKPQVASVAEHGPEFFMPLHNPDSARRFLDVVERAATERDAVRGPRLERHVPARGEGRGSARDSRETAALRREVAELRREQGRQTDRLAERLEAALTRVGIDDDSASRVGDAAGNGAVGRISGTRRGRKAVEDSLNRTDRRANFVGS